MLVLVAHDGLRRHDAWRSRMLEPNWLWSPRRANLTRRHLGQADARQLTAG